MDTENRDQQVPPEELAAEQADAVLPKEDEVRAKIIEDTGFDPENEEDKGKIDKLVTREMDGRKKLSSAIGAKVKWRTEATKKPPAENKQNKSGNENNSDADKEAKEPALSTDEIYLLMENKVPKEDVEEVRKAAKLLGKNLADTLNDEMVKGILKTRSEHRLTANASNTGGGQRSNSKVSDADLLKRASEGDIPEPGSPEAEQLFWARKGGKK